MERRHQGGQATVELALCLPFVAFLLGILFELAMIAVDQVRLTHAAREAARAAAVEPDPRAAQLAASSSGLRSLEVGIEPEREGRVQGEPLTVSLAYTPESRLPLMGFWVGDIRLSAAATMRIESP